MPSLIGKVPSWTFVGLVLAYVDLWVAYVLLCVSACIFLPSKLLSFLGFFLPCPCIGIWGYQSSEFCWHRLLIDWPIETISFVLRLVVSRFPFGLFVLQDINTDLAVNNSETAKINLCSSRIGNRANRGECKGKGISQRRNKSLPGQRRRGVSCSVLCTTANSVHDRGGSSSASASTLCSSTVKDDIILDGGYSTTNGVMTRCGEFYGKKSKAIMDDSSCEKLGLNEDSLVEIYEKCRVLERLLREEKTAHAAVCSELEKERAAAASAAEEAMGMILRLQEDKSAMELEARHYHRLIEEKFAYEEEEMGILKEILMKREKENLFLEKEIQCFKEMTSPDKEVGNKSFIAHNLSPGLNERESQTFTLCDESSSSDNENESSSHLPEYVKSSTCSSQPSSQKAGNLYNGRSMGSNGFALQGPGETDCFAINHDVVLKDANKNMDADSVETESAVHDIFVVAENAAPWKENDQENVLLQKS